MRPFVFWFSYMDPAPEGGPDEYDDLGPHVQCCIILGETEEAAHTWGKDLAQRFLVEEPAKSIERTWIEQMVPYLLTEVGPIEVSWEALSATERQTLYHCSASNNPKQLTATLNGAVQAKDEATARRVWERHLHAFYDGYASEGFNQWLPPILHVGDDVDWDS